MAGNTSFQRRDFFRDLNRVLDFLFSVQMSPTTIWKKGDKSVLPGMYTRGGDDLTRVKIGEGMGALQSYQSLKIH